MAEPSVQGSIYSVFEESPLPGRLLPSQKSLAVEAPKKAPGGIIRPEQGCLRELQALWWRAVLRVSVVTVFIR